LRSQADALLACAFIETVTLNGQRQYILAVIEHSPGAFVYWARRRTRPPPGSSRPHKNLVVDLQDAGWQARYLIRDRDGKFSTLIKEILTDAGIQTLLTGVPMPRMNAMMERWVQSCRHDGPHNHRYCRRHGGACPGAGGDREGSFGWEGSRLGSSWPGQCASRRLPPMVLDARRGT
jgi:hypothetical protein